MNRKIEIMPVYKKLQEDKNPIFIWGTGALARDVYKYCKNFGIKVEGFFVNIGNREDRFEEHPVFSLEELEHEYKRVSVIIGHHRYEEGISVLRPLPYIDEIYYLTTVSYEMWENLSPDIMRTQRTRWENIYNRLADELSQKCLKSYLEARVYDDARMMFSCYDDTKNYYKQDFLSLTDEETYLDIGACVGNTVWSFIKAVNGKYNKIIALEPDKSNYEKLCTFMLKQQYSNIETRQICAWKKSGTVGFQGDGELGGITNENSKEIREIPAIAIDDLDATISLIKINFPFSVSDILDGGIKLLKAKKAKLIIRVGFNEGLILETCEKIWSLNSEYHIFFRYTLGMPEGLTLYAI